MRNLRDFVGFFNKQLLEELDVYTGHMLNRMSEFFKKYATSLEAQLSKQHEHLENLKEVIHMTKPAEHFQDLNELNL